MFHRASAAVLWALKWPVAVACAAYLPATAWCLVLQCAAIGHLGGRWSLLVGALGYSLAWALLLRHVRVGFLSTLEHELTHCLFAWLTGNRVTRLTAALHSGGEMRIDGTPNWLIAVAPYFFPTVSALLLVAAVFVDPRWQSLLYGGLGASIAYHVISTFQETHRSQSDLREAGLVFSILFLPTANLLSYALILGAMQGGGRGIVAVLHAIAYSPLEPLQVLHEL
jgi:hypothetical protein